jgi:hypothetical protein
MAKRANRPIFQGQKYYKLLYRVNQTHYFTHGMKKFLFTIYLLAASSLCASADLIDFDFSGVNGTVDPGKETFELTATDSIDAGLSLVTGLNFQTPSTVIFNTAGTTSTSNDLNVSGWGSGGSFSAAFNGNRYMTFTIQAQAGKQLNLDGATVTYTAFRNGNGAPSEFGITATTGGSAVVIGDQIGSDISVPNTGPTNIASISAPFSGAQWDGLTVPVEIRIYGAGTSTGGNMHFSDLTITGGSIIPEPSSMVLTTFGSLLLVLSSSQRIKKEQ